MSRESAEGRLNRGKKEYPEGINPETLDLQSASPRILIKYYESEAIRQILQNPTEQKDYLLAKAILAKEQELARLEGINPNNFKDIDPILNELQGFKVHQDITEGMVNYIDIILNRYAKL